MKRIKATAIVLVALMAVQTFASAVLATDDANTTTTDTTSVPMGSVVLVPSIADSLPADNLLTNGAFNSSDCMSQLTFEGPKVANVTDSNCGYIRVSDIPMSHTGVRYTPETTIGAGKYLFTGYFRTLRMGEPTELRVVFSQVNGESKIAYVYPMIMLKIT